MPTRASGGKTEFCGACFACRRKEEQESRCLKKRVRAPAPSTTVKNILGCSARNGKFKPLEPHFQLSATRSASKEGTETAVALPNSRECAPRSPYLACQIMFQSKSSELEQNHGISYGKNLEVKVPVIDLTAPPKIICRQCNTGVLSPYGGRGPLPPNPIQ